MALAIIGLALALAMSPWMIGESFGAETEWGLGGYYGWNVEGFGGTPDKYNYNLGTSHLYYGWKKFKFAEDLHIGFEGYLGMYEFSPGGNEFVTGLNLNFSYDLFKYMYAELGLGVGYVSGAPGDRGEVIATNYVPGIFQLGLGFQLPARDDNYWRIGARAVHQSGIFYGEPFTRNGDPGTNLIGIFASYYW